MFRGLDPERAKDLQDRRERYERRARSIRYGSVRAGSGRHLLQAWWRSLTDLRRPTRFLLVVMTIGSACIAAAGLGVRNAWLLAVAGGALPLILIVVGFGTWVHERRTAVPAGLHSLVSPPERPARRAPQDS